jgi:hypothetical protein
LKFTPQTEERRQALWKMMVDIEDLLVKSNPNYRPVMRQFLKRLLDAQQSTMIHEAAGAWDDVRGTVAEVTGRET